MIGPERIAEWRHGGNDLLIWTEVILRLPGIDLLWSRPKEDYYDRLDVLMIPIYGQCWTFSVTKHGILENTQRFIC